MAAAAGTPPQSKSPAYTVSQLKAYYNRINLPAAHRHEPGPDAARVAQDPDRGLAFLTALQQYTLASIPFENLDLHYSHERTISLDPDHLFRKIVESDRGRGGYCMETNKLLGTVLASLGFDVYPTGGRIHRGIHVGKEHEKHFIGWSHMIHLVNLGDTKYMVDVGNGQHNPTIPTALSSTSVHPIPNIAPQLRRLIKSSIPDTVTRTLDQQLWRHQLQHEPAKSSPWVDIYCYSEMEFLPVDFEAMNYVTSHNPESWFTRVVHCNKHLMQDGEFVGTVTLHGNQLWRREKGIKVWERELQSEQERVRVLKEVMGISLAEKDVRAMRGFVSEIKGS